MTSNLVLISLCLASLLRMAVRDSYGKASTHWLCLAIFFMLPLTFGPMASISHIVFELSAAWIFWPALVLCMAMLASLSARIGNSSRPAGVARVSLWLAIGCIALCLSVGIFQADFESGPTLTIAGSPALFVSWLAAVIAVLCLALTLANVTPLRKALAATGLCLLALAIWSSV